MPTFLIIFTPHRHTPILFSPFYRFSIESKVYIISYLILFCQEIPKDNSFLAYSG